MEPESKPPQETQPPHSSRTIYVGGTLVILIAALALVWYAIGTPREDAEPTFELPSTGKIYITLLPDEQALPSVYAYNFATKELERGSEEVFEDGTYIRYTSSVSPDGKELAYFMATPYDPEERPELGCDPEHEEGEGRCIPFATSLYLTSFPFDDPDRWRRWDMDALSQDYLIRMNPVWSPDATRLAFMALPHPEENDDIKYLSFWTIFMSSRTGDGNSMLVQEGAAHPHWSPDGDSLLYTKEDGLYMMDMQTEEEERVWELSGRPATNNRVTIKKQIDVSQDGSKLLINHEGLRIELFDIESWEPFVLSNPRDLTTNNYYLWPTFSPDGKYVAAVKFPSFADRHNPALATLAVIDVATGADREVLSLAGYDVNLNIISDWR